MFYCYIENIKISTTNLPAYIGSWDLAVLGSVIHLCIELMKVSVTSEFYVYAHQTALQE